MRCKNTTVSFRRLHAESLERRMLLATQPMISEFQAVNDSTIQDQDGDYSDWIEILNPSTESINLAGWYLTDDIAELRKWRFPDVNVQAGESRLVFASGKTRMDQAELHANFRLSGQGEYLALVRPDGTVAHDFGKRFPPQSPDHSYGLSFQRDAVSLVDRNAAVSVLVPRDGSLGSEWTATEFDDADWMSGNGAVGFEILREAFSEREEFDAPLVDPWTVDLPNGASSTVNVVDGRLIASVPRGQNTGADDRGLAPIVFRDVPGNPTDWEIVTHIEKLNPRDRGAVGLAIFDTATGKPALLLEQTGGRTRFQLISGTTTVGTWSQLNEGSFFLRIVRNQTEKTWSTFAKIEEQDDWVALGTVTDGVGDAPTLSDPRPAVFARTSTAPIEVAFSFVEINVAEQRSSYFTEISSDVGASMHDVNSSVYQRIPFQVEGDPSRFDVVGLGVRYDDGFKAYLNGTEITSQNAPLNATWNSAASGAHGAVGDHIPLERIELSDAVSSLREGQNVLAIHGMNVAASDSDFFYHGTMVASRLLPLQERSFAVPTPGRSNSIPQAPVPMIKAQDGVFFGATQVEMDVEMASSTLEIRYTLDGTEPTPDSALYTGPLSLSDSAMLQARTFDTLPLPNFEPSQVSTATLLAASQELRQRTSNMPLMIIDTLGQGLPGSDSNDLRPANAVLFDVSTDTLRSSIDNGIVDYLGRVGVRDRGKSTAGQPKPNLATEIWGTTGSTKDDDFDASLLGLPAESDWVLYAPYSIDQSMIRNALVYELSNQMGMWAPRTRFVEMYLNREDGVISDDDYAGVYVLMEKIKQGPDRVDIEEIRPDNSEPPEVTGGYIWKVDTPDPDAPTFMAGGQPMNWVYPKSPLSTTAGPARRATAEQEQWVQGYFEQFEASLENPDVTDANGYVQFVDVNSWIDQHILRTMMRDVDAFALSSFMHKDRNGKLVLGPAWDFDRTADSSQIGSDDSPYLFRTSFGSSRWFAKMFDDPGFWQLYVDRWQMWRETVLSDENVAGVLSDLASQVGESAQRNIERWSAAAPRVASPFGSGALDGTYQGEVEHLRRWLAARTNFLDSNYTGNPELLVQGDPLGDDPEIVLPSGQEIQFRSAPIEIFDDTPLVAGARGAAEASYLVPDSNDLGQSWTQVDFDDTSWARGPAGLGYGRAFAELVDTEVDPRDVSKATNILTRFSFNVDQLKGNDDRRLVLRMKYDDAFVAYLNGVELTSQNFDTDAIGWDTRPVKRDNREAAEFADFDVTQFKHVLIEGTNVLAIRGVDTRDGDMLILPELLLRTVRIGRGEQAKVYYTVDGSDPRGPDGNPSSTAVESAADKGVTIVSNTQIIARSFDPFERGFEGEIVGTHWSSPVQYQFVVSPPLDQPNADFDGNGMIGVADIDRLFAEFRSTSAPDTRFDLTGDGAVDQKDRDALVHDILNTHYGDSNLDGVFNARDIVAVLQSSEFKDGIPGNSTWEDGDWNGDGEFNTEDIVLALQDGGFVAGEPDG